MSQVKVVRRWFSAQSTIGELYLDDSRQCYTLEPRKDQSQGKPYCIPIGEYQLTIRFSPRFGGNMPHVENVPNFDGILIHWGNSQKDTEGCILVGETLGPNPDWIGSSRAAFTNLFIKLTLGTITISEEPQN